MITCDDVSPNGNRCIEVAGEGWHLRGWHIAGWVREGDEFVPRFRWRTAPLSADARPGGES